MFYFNQFYPLKALDHDYFYLYLNKISQTMSFIGKVNVNLKSGICQSGNMKVFTMLHLNNRQKILFSSFEVLANKGISRDFNVFLAFVSRVAFAQCKKNSCNIQMNRLIQSFQKIVLFIFNISINLKTFSWNTNSVENLNKSYRYIIKLYI